MAKVLPGSYAARLKPPFVVFIIGARVNHWLAVHRWWPVISAMPAMIKELKQNPADGLLHVEQLGMGGSVQYWKSYALLEKYARRRDREHWPAWQRAKKVMEGNAAVGFWHETYEVTKGHYENIYTNMPATGLGVAGELVEINDKLNTAAKRKKNL